MFDKGQEKRKKCIWWAVICLELILAVYCIIGLCGERERLSFGQENSAVLSGGYDEAGVYYVDETEGAAGAVCLSTGNLSLKKGVYEVFLDFDAEAEQVVGVYSESLGYRALEQNEVSLRPSNLQKDVSFRFRLKENADDVRVDITYTGEGRLAVSDFYLVHTRQEYGMTLFFLVLFSVLLDGLFYLWATGGWRGSKQSFQPVKKQIIFGLAVIFLLSCSNLFIDYTHLGDDAYFHLSRIEGIAREWQAGHFPARMESYWMYGMGYPVSIMYGDFFLWPAAFLRIVGFDLSFCYKSCIVLLNLMAVLISYFSFKNIFRSRAVGLWGSGMYTLSLYRLYNIYTRAAVGEFTAMTFFPLICWGLTEVFSKDEERVKQKKNVFLLAFGYVGILFSHVLSLEFAAVFTLLLCIILWKRFFRKSTFLTLVKAALLAVGLGLWYLIPFLDYSLHMDMQVFHAGNPIQVLGLYIMQLFWVFPWNGLSPYMYATGMQNVRPYGMGLGLAVVFITFLYLLAHGWTKRREDRDWQKTTVAAGTGMLAMLMCLHIFPWDAISESSAAAEKVVYSIQFPYRFLVIVTVSLTYLGGGIFAMLRREKDRKRGNIFAVTALLGTLFCGMFFLNDELINRGWSDLQEAASMGALAIGNGEYLLEGTETGSLPYTQISAGDGVIVRDYERQDGQVRFYCINEGEKESYVQCNLLYYLGYHAWGPKARIQELETACGENNVLCVIIPAGYGGPVEVAFTGETLWKMGDMVSLALWAALAGYGVYLIRRHREGFGKNRKEERKVKGVEAG